MKETSTSSCQCPSRCFCKYRVDDLEVIGRKKLVEKLTTVSLMQKASNTRNKDLICVISMLDIDDSIAEIMIQEHMAIATCEVLACRENLKCRFYRRLKVW